MGKLSGKIVLTVALAVLLILFSWGPTPSQAAGGPDTYWVTSGTGYWDDPGNWTTGVPSSNTNPVNAFIDAAGTALISASEAAAQNLIVGQTVMGSSTANVISHTDKLLTVSGTLTLGQEAVGSSGNWQGADGLYYMDDTGSSSPNLVAGTLIVSDKGYGAFLQQGGTVTVTNNLILGNQILAGGTQDAAYPISGQYNMWQGATAPNLTVGSQLIVGNAGYGGFEQYNGSVAVLGSHLDGDGALVIGSQAGSQGYYRLENDAKLTVGQEDFPTTMYVGQGGSGYLSIDYYGGTGGDPYSFKLFGDLVVGDQATGWGMIEQKSGAAIVTGNLTLGNLSGAYGEYSLFQSTYSDEMGNVTTYGPTSLNVEGSLIVGRQSGGGNFFQQGGNVTVNQDLILGQHQYSSGNYQLVEVTESGADEGGSYSFTSRPASLNVQGYLMVGQSGYGSFSQYGGTVAVNQDLILGQQQYSTGNYYLSSFTESEEGDGWWYSNTAGPASLTVGGSGLGNLMVGQSGNGYFSQEGGTVAVNQNLILGQQATSSGDYYLFSGTDSEEEYTYTTHPAILTVGGSFIAGQSGNGSFTQEGGSVTVSRDLILGQQAASSGNYSLFGGTQSGDGEGGAYTSTTNPAYLTVGGSLGGSLIVGQSGNGSFSQEGGTVTVGQDLILGQEGYGSGQDPPAYGSYHLFEGTKSSSEEGDSTTTAASLEVQRNLIVGQYGEGGFDQKGGSVTVRQDLILGQEVDSYGRYSLFEGSGSYENGSYVLYTTGPASLNIQGNLIVGQHGVGEFDQDGGTATVNGSLVLANGEHYAEGNDGEYYLYNGTLNILGQGAGESGNFPAAMIVGAAGQGYFYQENGVLTVHGDLIAGDRPNSAGDIKQYGGTATVTGNLILGNQASVDDASYPAYGSYYIGGSESTASLDVQGYLIVGNSGGGWFTQDSGSVHVSQDLILGNQGYDARGNYGMDGTPASSTLHVDQDLIVGNIDGSGYLNQSGGAVTVGRDLILGNQSYGASGEYYLYGTPATSTLQVTRDLIVGNIDGWGYFNQSGGAVTVGQDLILGNQTYDAYGEYYLSGAPDSSILNVSRDLIVGRYGYGYFSQEGGALTVHNNFIVGDQPGSGGEYYLYGGSLTVGQDGAATAMYVGKGGEGYFQIGGGEGNPPFTLYGDLVVSDQAGSYGEVIQYGGSADVYGNLTLGNAGPDTTNPDNPLYPAWGGYALVDGALTVGQEGSLTSNMVVGAQGEGYFLMGLDPYSDTTGNPTFTLNGHLVVADQAGSYGEVYHYDGTANVLGSLTIGNAGAVTPESGDPIPAAMGMYTLVNGALNVGGVPGINTPQEMIVGKSGNGYFLVGIDPFMGSTGSPTFNMNGELIVGLQAGSVGGVLHGAGQATVNGDLTLGVHGASADPVLPAAMGAYVLGPVTFPGSDPLGADPTLTVTGNVNVGLNGLGGFSQTGGTLTAGGVFLGTDTAGVGGYVLEGGSLNTPLLNVGLRATGGTVQFPTEIETPFEPLSLQQAAILFPFLQDLPIDLDTGTYIGPGGYFYQTGGAISTNHVEVGVMAGSWGHYQMSGGSLTITQAGEWDGALILGRDGASGSIPAASGTFELSGSGSLTAAEILVGDSGVGTFTQTGGEVNTNHLEVGAGAGSTGLYQMSGGTLNVLGQDTLILGRDGASGSIPAATGKFTLLDGFLTVGQTGASTTMYVGQGGTGTLYLGIDFDSLVVGGNPTLTLYGDLIAGDQAGSYGRVLQFGSTATVTGNLTLGNLQGASSDYSLFEGTYSTAGGTYTSGTGNLTVLGSLIGGQSGDGGLAQSGGTVTVAQNLILGQQGTSNGYYEIFGGSESGEDSGGTYSFNTGPAYLTVGGSLIVGQSGTGSFSQDGGEVAVSHDLVLGQQQYSYSDYHLFDGSKSGEDEDGSYSYTTGSATLTVGGSLIVGQAGTAAVFFQDGGSVTVAHDLILSQQQYAPGSYNLFEGTRVDILTTSTASLTVGGSLIVGQAGPGSFKHEGGAVAVGSDLVLGDQTSSSGNYSLFDGSLSGVHLGSSFSYTTGPATLDVQGRLMVGQSGSGSFTQEGGTVTVNQDMILGQGGSSSGSYAIFGGTKEFDSPPYGNRGYTTAGSSLDMQGSLIVGQAGTGSFAHDGGTVTVHQDLILGQQTSSSGTYSLFEGAKSGPDGPGSFSYTTDPAYLTVGGSLIVGQAGTGTFTQSGGTLNNPGTIVLGQEAGSTGTFNLQDGTVNAQNITVGHSGVGTFEMSGGSLTVAPGGQLRIGLTGSGAFNQTGGEFIFAGSTATTDYLKVGVNGGTGSYALGGTATLAVDGMTILGHTSDDSGGTGYFTQYGGTHTIVRTTDPLYEGDGGRLLLGNRANTYGHYELAGGLLQVGGKEILGLSELYKTTGGTGVFVQSGGTNIITGQTQPDGAGRLVAGWYDNTVGTYEMSGGTFRADRIILGNDGPSTNPLYPTQPDASGKGKMTIGGNGNVVVEDLIVGNVADHGNGGFGWLDLASQDAYVEVTGNYILGGQGIFTAVPGAIIHMTGTNFIVTSANQENLAGLMNVKLIFTGGPGVIDTFELGVEVGSLEIGSDSHVHFVDNYDNNQHGSEVMQIDYLVLNPGATIDFFGDSGTGSEYVNIVNLILQDGATLSTAVLDPSDLSYLHVTNETNVTTHTPIPASLLLLGTGLLGLGALGWRRRRQG